MSPHLKPERVVLASPKTATQPQQLTWQQTKSQLTQQAILQAAVDCFFEYGYAHTSTDHISKKAGVSRGAMLHHYPARFDLIRATVAYLNQQRLEMFAREESAVQNGAQYSRVKEGIEAYWRQLNTPVFVVFHELTVAARTDLELAEVIQPALAEFETAWYEAVKDIFPDLAQSEAFHRANYLTKYLLEGMAIARFTHTEHVPHKLMLEWLQGELKRSFQDVLGSVKRDV